MSITAGSGSRAFTEQALTITPVPAAGMAGSAARVVRTAAIRSSSIVACPSASVMDRNPQSGPPVGSLLDAPLYVDQDVL